MPHTDLYIVDNAVDNRSAKKYLAEWCSVSKQMDIATGYFEIGGLLELDGEWQKLNKIRLLFGDEVTRRTKDAFDNVVSTFLSRLNESIEVEKEKNEFLVGVPAILKAIKDGKIECRVYSKDKFHAKAYITYFTDEYYGLFNRSMNISNGYALVGSSNFTKAGLTKNIELNVQVANDVEQLQNWFDSMWDEAVDISDALLKVIEKQSQEYSPYDVYLKSMYEYFRGQEQTLSEWEQEKSKIFNLLSQYQKDGYNSLVKIAEKYSGAFLCDGVGLGKTFVGMMLIERFVKKERKNVVLIVPASARISVWEATIKKYIPEILDGFYSFKIINHTDLLRDGCQNLMDKISEQAEVVVIDEAHHFRNRSSNRYRKLFEMIGQAHRKQMYMLTATPINNSFLDLQHLIELFSQRKEDYFKDAPLGIHSLAGHFRKMENLLESATNAPIVDASDSSIEVESILKTDYLVNELVVQRSRAYVKKSLSGVSANEVLFPIRQAPTVASYSLKKTYGKLINDFIDSFDRKDKETGRKVPILALAVYSPYDSEYFIGDKAKVDLMKLGRQNQVVNLIRQLLLKRFESSAAAFEETCIRIFIRLKKFLDDYKELGNQREIDRFFTRRERIITYISDFNLKNATSTEDIEDDLPDYVWNVEDVLSISDFNIPVMLQDTIGDLEVLSDFIDDLMETDPSSDDKIRALKDILHTDVRVKGKKVLIFSEYRSTAKHIFRELQNAGFKSLFELDGQSKFDRKDVIERFAPYYNDKTSSQIDNEIKILVATDVLAEGLNLQDSTCIINYELHWNPVRLIQRIGRVDRRRSRVIEELLMQDHPEVVADRQNVYYWNFLPPSELESLLSLHHTVSQKALRISKTFGIEGKQLLTPDDDFEALKDFNSAYEGVESKDEEIALEYQRLMQENPGYEEAVLSLPRKMFSGRIANTKKGIFFCYMLPTKRADGIWTEVEGLCKWYLLNAVSGGIEEAPYEIWKAIRSMPEDPRVFSINAEEFAAQRKTIEAYLTKAYMRAIQAPIGIKPKLLAWMQLY